MSKTRYSPSRTLVRPIRRMPKQDPAQFKQNTARLRAHFERFNTDVAELCQWFMGLRPGGKNYGEELQPFWDFFLDPESAIHENSAKTSGDSLRLAVFRAVAGWDPEDRIAKFSLNDGLADSIRCAAQHPLTPTAQKLFTRLRALVDAHLYVLLKAAAEWILARYQRAFENSVKQRAHWEKEKSEWESRHPELTPKVRETYNEIFRALAIKEKRPRVCSWERLENLTDNCEFNGVLVRKKDGFPASKKRHAQLCQSYYTFLDDTQGKERRNVQKFFAENAERYLAQREIKRQISRSQALDEYIVRNKKRSWFKSAWERYLKTVKVHEDTLINQYGGKLPHCTSFSDDTDCGWNRHTDACVQYRDRLRKLDKKTRDLEPVYREWRRYYLAAPRKPSFAYPSARLLPMPKIFGQDFYTVDFERSIVHLRLDDMPKGEFLPFAFLPWPKDYSPQPAAAQITSVHVNFIGTRPRIGFRFDVAHAESRFTVTQDEIDYLRSNTYPRKSEDQQFLDAVRQRLLDSFTGGSGPIRVLVVDLGSSTAATALFEGKRFVSSSRLKIAKLDKLKPSFKDEDPENTPGDGSAKTKRAGRGLGVEHVNLHGKEMETEASAIANKRLQLREEEEKENGEDQNDRPVTLGRHDLRGLSLHVRRMIRDWVRLNAKQIIDHAVNERADLVVFESMRGFLPPGYDKLDPELTKKKRWLAYFSYGAIRRKVTEKAVERGMRTVTVPYLCSSQYCCACGQRRTDEIRWKKNKRQHAFVCEHANCRHHDQRVDSDENAARVLGRVFWGEIVLPVDEAEAVVSKSI